ncbi:uncharacterized protein [Zea mays]|uniref:Uncharacterized protein n=1 Tax=Zea mays TaxID=4577 RepID=B8A092_MAIZE|nr:uncharacterized protein LOC103638202 [Zea mays]ACL53591.1 unknown [Zea mays]|eukprot:XP_008659418.1 uncharacterized protein LOC103638202 [Zea mays]
MLAPSPASPPWSSISLRGTPSSSFLSLSVLCWPVLYSSHPRRGFCSLCSESPTRSSPGSPSLMASACAPSTLLAWPRRLPPVGRAPSQSPLRAARALLAPLLAEYFPHKICSTTVSSNREASSPCALASAVANFAIKFTSTPCSVCFAVGYFSTFQFRAACPVCARSRLDLVVIPCVIKKSQESGGFVSVVGTVRELTT